VEDSLLDMTNPLTTVGFYRSISASCVSCGALAERERGALTRSICLLLNVMVEVLNVNEPAVFPFQPTPLRLWGVGPAKLRLRMLWRASSCKNEGFGCSTVLLTATQRFERMGSLPAPHLLWTRALQCIQL
jgi:hypothetical protein